MQKSLHYNFREISQRGARERASGITFSSTGTFQGYSRVSFGEQGDAPSSFESNYDFQKAKSVIEYYAFGRPCLPSP
jgi:hypothetical protein